VAQTTYVTLGREEVAPGDAYTPLRVFFDIQQTIMSSSKSHAERGTAYTVLQGGHCYGLYFRGTCQCPLGSNRADKHNAVECGMSAFMVDSLGNISHHGLFGDFTPEDKIQLNFPDRWAYFCAWGVEYKPLDEEIAHLPHRKRLNSHGRPTGAPMPLRGSDWENGCALRFAMELIENKWRTYYHGELNASVVDITRLA
jgi:hypothetical protein